MALQKDKQTDYGVFNYWRIFNINASKNGGESQLGLNSSLGLYVDKSHSDNGKGAFETRQITFNPSFPIESIQGPFTEEQVAEAIGVIVGFMYQEIKAGRYDIPDGEANFFADAQDV